LKSRIHHIIIFFSFIALVVLSSCGTDGDNFPPLDPTLRDTVIVDNTAMIEKDGQEVVIYEARGELCEEFFLDQDEPVYIITIAPNNSINEVADWVIVFPKPADLNTNFHNAYILTDSSAGITGKAYQSFKELSAPISVNTELLTDRYMVGRFRYTSQVSNTVIVTYKGTFAIEYQTDC